MAVAAPPRRRAGGRPADRRLRRASSKEGELKDVRMAMRERNEARAEDDAERGPARQDQDAVPIVDALRAYHDAGNALGGMPAHKMGNGAPRPAVELLGRDVFRNDISDLHGFDNRH